MKKNIAWYLLCSVPFFIFFLQFPLQHSLTGDLDGIANLAMYKEIKYWIDCQFSKEVYTAICFPIKNAWIFFGADFGIGIIHVLFNYLGFNDLWAHYLFFSILFSLNAIGLFLLINELYHDKLVALLASLIYGFCHYTIANLENPNTLVFFLSFLSIRFIFKFYTCKNRKVRFLIYSMLIGAIQIYFSPYNFLFHFIIISCIIIYFDFKRLISLRYLYYSLGSIIIILPYLIVFIFGSNVAKSYNIISEYDSLSLFSLSINDLFHGLPNHLYAKPDYSLNNPWAEKINAAYLGIFFYSSALWAIFKIKLPHKKLFIALTIIGFIVAFGPFIIYNGSKICPSLTYPLYKYFRFDDILRFPIRAFFISIFAFTVLISATLKQLKIRSKLFAYLLFICILLESIPLKMEVYNHQELLNVENQYLNALHDLQPKNCLNLPSNLFTYEYDKREYYYMYWHHLYQCNIVNGNLAFFPDGRMYSYEMLRDNELNHTLDLCNEYEIDCIVFHKDLIYNKKEQDLLAALTHHPSDFRIAYNSDKKIIFMNIKETNLP